MPQVINRQQIMAAALTGTGLSHLARRSRPGQACILTFHGLTHEREAADLLDQSLHTPLPIFRKICAHLAAHYRVVPLREIAGALAQGRPLPDRAVAITFDDGY